MYLHLLKEDIRRQYMRVFATPQEGEGAEVTA